MFSEQSSIAAFAAFQFPHSSAAASKQRTTLSKALVFDAQLRAAYVGIATLLNKETFGSSVCSDATRGRCAAISIILNSSKSFSAPPDDETPSVPSNLAQSSNKATDEISAPLFVSPRVFKGFPKAGETKLKKSERSRSFIATDTPEKDKIEEKELAKKEKEELKKRKQKLKKRKEERKKDLFSKKDEIPYKDDSEMKNGLLNSRLQEVPTEFDEVPSEPEPFSLRDPQSVSLPPTPLSSASRASTNRTRTAKRQIDKCDQVLNAIGKRFAAPAAVEGKFTLIGKIWAMKLRDLLHSQAVYAEKLINNTHVSTAQAEQEDDDYEIISLSPGESVQGDDGHDPIVAPSSPQEDLFEQLSQEQQEVPAQAAVETYSAPTVRVQEPLFEPEQSTTSQSGKNFNLLRVLYEAGPSTSQNRLPTPPPTTPLLQHPEPEVSSENPSTDDGPYAQLCKVFGMANVYNNRYRIRKTWLRNLKHEVENLGQTNRLDTGKINIISHIIIQPKTVDQELSFAECENKEFSLLYKSDDLEANNQFPVNTEEYKEPDQFIPLQISNSNLVSTDSEQDCV
ncbi:hypothetical protein FQR65_LT15718 [Abscondita terminalis]|nr:hypothetical protein FQR65_LT15718 [Abscondita terminalis]